MSWGLFFISFSTVSVAHDTRDILLRPARHPSYVCQIRVVNKHRHYIEMAPSTRSSGRSHTAASYRESLDTGSDSEEEYTAPKRTKKQPGTRLKKTKTAAASANFEENGLYRALSAPDIAIYDLVLEWIDSFEEGESVEAFTELFNLLLRCCGCTFLVQPHDLVNLESSHETVGELKLLFEKQKYHEYPFVSSNKELKFFKKNVLEFFEVCVSVAHEKDLLYVVEPDEEASSPSWSPLMKYLLTWLTSLSACTVRPFRYVSTIVLLTVQTKLVELVVGITSSSEKQQRHINNIKSNSKSKRNQLSHKNKIESINDTIKAYHNQKETILMYCTEIMDTTFVFRYRDIDAVIRQECLKHLGEWMLTYPDFFLQPSYLCYFGYLFSDPSDNVRIEVTRVIGKLYRNANSAGLTMDIRFRQFTEKFKTQMINMSWKDNSFNVKHNLIGVCCELLKIGFLDVNDTYEIALNFFYLVQSVSDSNSGNDEKLKVELAKFISMVNVDNVKNEAERFSIFINSYESAQFGDSPDKLSLQNCLKFRNLVQFLQATQHHYETNREQKFSPSVKKTTASPIPAIFKYLYCLPTYSSTWEFLVRYYLYDLSSISFVPKESSLQAENVEVSEFKALLELSSESDRYSLLCLIMGAFSSIYASRNGKKADLPENIDEPSNALSRLAELLPSLANALSKSESLFVIFLQLWNLLLNPANSCAIFIMFSNLGQISVYNSITKKLLKSFQLYDIKDFENDPAADLFEEFFGYLLPEFSNYANLSSTGIQLGSTNTGVLTTEIRLAVQSLLQELTKELKETLAMDTMSSISTNEEDLDVSLEEQLSVCKILQETAKSLFKMNKIANVINVNPYVIQDAYTSVTDMLLLKVITKLDIVPLIKFWPSNYLQIVDTYTVSFKVVLDFLLVSNCWKLEDLLYVPASEDNNQQSQYDIEHMFSDINVIIDHMLRIIGSFDESLKILGDTTPNSNSVILIKKLIDLKTLFCAKFVDLSVSLKIFYIKFRNNNSFTNFNSFFGDRSGVGKFISKEIPVKVQNLLLDVFLHKETRLASLLGVVLDRTDGEDVNFEELHKGFDDDDQGELVQKSGFDDSDDDENDDDEDDEQARAAQQEIETWYMELEAALKKQAKVWLAEKELCVFAVKLFSLINTGMVNEFVLTRLKLNSYKIGGLFQDMLNENDKLLATKGPLEPISSDISMTAGHASTPATEIVENPEHSILRNSQIELDLDI